MNKQRKVVITITYNEMGIIVDTKAEELGSSAQPEPEWIPVSERLPEKAGKYLVTVTNGNVYAGTFDKFSGRFQCAAVAWMPLPEPYKENKDERD